MSMMRDLLMSCEDQRKTAEAAGEPSTPLTKMMLFRNK